MIDRIAFYQSFGEKLRDESFFVNCIRINHPPRRITNSTPYFYLPIEG
jgi:hypothetical protein